MNNSKFRGTCSEIDPIAIKKLYFDYHMTNQEIANLTWSTKANVNRILNGGAKYYISWQIYELTENEKGILQNMLIKHLFELYDEANERKYLIKNDSKEKICFIWYDSDSVQCLFDEDFPEELKKLSIDEHMNAYNNLDYQVLEGGKEDSILKKPCIFLDSEMKKIFDKAAKKRKLKGTDYAKFLGFDNYLIEKDKNRDSNIKKFLDEHSIDGVVYLSSAPENQWIRTYASRCDMSIDDFVSFFGYTKSRYDYNYISQNKNEKYRNKLKDYIIKEPNFVYIPTQDSIYQNLYSIAKLNNMTLNEYISKLGYQRLMRMTKIEELSDEIEKIIEKEKYNIEKEKYTTEKVKRNHQLIDNLKSIYNYECQLCTDEQQMLIKKMDGTNYVEVHHIKQLSLEFDEEGTLDRVKNLIVVCPNHHKMLHYHNGGYIRIEKRNGGLVFVNDSTETIPIIKNKHIEPVQ